MESLSHSTRTAVRKCIDQLVSTLFAEGCSGMSVVDAVNRITAACTSAEVEEAVTALEELIIARGAMDEVILCRLSEVTYAARNDHRTTRRATKDAC